MVGGWAARVGRAGWWVVKLGQVVGGWAARVGRAG